MNINKFFQYINCNYTKVKLECQNLNLNRVNGKDIRYLEKYPPDQLNVVEITNGQNLNEIPPHFYTLNIRPFLLVLFLIQIL